MINKYSRSCNGVRLDFTRYTNLKLMVADDEFQESQLSIIKASKDYDDILVIDSLNIPVDQKEKDEVMVYLKDFCDNNTGIPILCELGFTNSTYYDYYMESGDTSTLESLINLYETANFINCDEKYGNTKPCITLLNENKHTIFDGTAESLVKYLKSIGKKETIDNIDSVIPDALRKEYSLDKNTRVFEFSRDMKNISE